MPLFIAGAAVLHHAPRRNVKKFQPEAGDTCSGRAQPDRQARNKYRAQIYKFAPPVHVNFGRLSYGLAHRPGRRSLLVLAIGRLCEHRQLRMLRRLRWQLRPIGAGDIRNSGFSRRGTAAAPETRGLFDSLPCSGRQGRVTYIPSLPLVKRLGNISYDGCKLVR